TMNIIFGIVVCILWLAGVAVKETKSPAAIIAVMLALIFVFVIAFGTYPVLSIVSLYRSYRESGAEERRQVKWPLWGTIVAAGGKIFLSILGITISLLVLTGNAVPTIVTMLPEALSKMLYVLIPLSFAFAILKYRLMNIDVIIRRTVLYTILSAVVFILY